MKRPHALPSDEALQMIALYFAALADPMRIKIVHALMTGDHNVNSLVRITGGTQPNVSRHLHKLTVAGLIDRRKLGTQVIYSIADPSINELCERVCGVLEKRLAKQAKVIGRTVRR